MEIIKKINVPMALLCLIVTRLLFSSDSYAIAIAAVALTGLFAYSKYLKSKEVAPLDEQVRKEIESMRNQLSNIAVKTNIKPDIKPGQRFF